MEVGMSGGRNRVSAALIVINRKRKKVCEYVSTISYF